MERFRSGKGLSPLTQIEAYWRDLCSGGTVPMRSEVDPRALENALNHTFVLERIAPGVARFRLAGRVVSNLMGMEVRGMPFSSIFVAPAKSNVALHLEKVFSDTAIAKLSLCGQTEPAQPTLDLRMILLPLLSDFGEVNRALGAIVHDGTIGQTPRRLTVRHVSHERFGDIRTKEPVPGFAEPTAAYDTGIPYLRVVK
ncbi:MAG: PAS domain-containing protein [Pseudomonadota bacterium]